MNAQERAALALWLVSQRPMTTRSLATRLEISREGARVLMIKISRTVPVYFDEAGGVWRMCAREEVDDEQL